MALGKQLPIRLENDVEKRLEAAASKNGTTKSALIRLLAKTFVDQVVGSDGGVRLPPNWSDLLPKADLRAAKSTRSKLPRQPIGLTHRLNVVLNDEPSAEKPPEPKRVTYPAKQARKKKP